MKNRSFLLLMVGIFSVICIYNLYWTYSRLSLDTRLNSMTADERGDWIQDEDNANYYKRAVGNSFSLGLDLQGGMFITMQVGVDAVIEGLAIGVDDDEAFQKAMADARQKTANNQESFVTNFVESLREAAPNTTLATYFAGENTGLPFDASDAQVISRLEEEAQDAVDRSFNILRNRIDQFGVASPNLQKQSGTGRILIELPGVKDAERVRNLLRGTAELEFWPTYTLSEVGPYIEQINEIVRQIEGVSDSSAADTSGQADAGDAEAQVDDEAAADSSDDASSLAQALGQDTTAGAETEDLSQDEQAEKFRRENPLFARLLFPQQVPPSTPFIGYSHPSDTAQVGEWLRSEEVRAILPSDMEFHWTAKPTQDDMDELGLVALKVTPDHVAPLSGEVIADARQDYNENGIDPIVSMSMNAEGAKIWRNMTEQYTGKVISVVLDGLVYTAPTIEGVIPNGQSRITGNFTVEEARDLSNVLKSGKLPAPASIEGEETVGPTLGADTTQKGLISFFIGFAAVIVFMVLYYRGSGILASLVLLINLFFILGVASALQVVLTLPGIAGIVLTMGMAVDANVLIYERIREEIDAGRAFKSAVSVGFKNAVSAIVDGNITTLLTGIILYSFGTGPIRGFAVMLMIGILTTLIASLIITRLLLDWYTRRADASISFGTSGATSFFRRSRLNLVKNRRMTYVVVVALIAVFGFAISGIGFKLGPDFEGGRQYKVAFNDQVDVGNDKVEQVRDDITVAFGGVTTPIVKTVGAKNELLITTNYLLEQPDSEEQVQAALLQGLNTSFSAGEPSILKSTLITPTISQDIRDAAYKSVIVSLVVIFLYIFIRFRRWQFGLGALTSLTFNVLTVLGLFALLGAIKNLPFSVELDQSFIAAILTIVGYTINDTVVVFDRIRETVREDKSGAGMTTLFNRAINDTLSRTVITSLTTLITALVLFFFAGEVIRAFMLAISLGVVVGTLSTIFVASPISLDLIRRAENKLRTTTT